MKELLTCIVHLKLKKLFSDVTDNAYIQFFRYLFVGAVATVADWGILWLLGGVIGCGLYFSTAVAFAAGTVVNFVLSECFAFKGARKMENRSLAFLIFAATCLTGLLLTELIMFIIADKLDIHYMISKVIATAIVFMWNFFSKKLIIYRKGAKK